MHEKAIEGAGVALDSVTTESSNIEIQVAGLNNLKAGPVFQSAEEMTPSSDFSLKGDVSFVLTNNTSIPYVRTSYSEAEFKYKTSDLDISALKSNSGSPGRLMPGSSVTINVPFEISTGIVKLTESIFNQTLMIDRLDSLPLDFDGVFNVAGRTVSYPDITFNMKVSGFIRSGSTKTIDSGNVSVGDVTYEEA